MKTLLELALQAIPNPGFMAKTYLVLWHPLAIKLEARDYEEKRNVFREQHRMQFRYDASSGEFYAELLFFRNRGRGSGCNGKKFKVCGISYEQMLKKKRCIIEIKNKDELCAALAIVTMKAKADSDPEYQEIRKGWGFQKVLAEQLHREAGVPEGPCGFDKITQFQSSWPRLSGNRYGGDTRSSLV